MAVKKQTDINETGKKKFQKYLDEPAIKPDYKGSEKLAGKIALITGGDSGIGRSIALYFAREGANIAIVYKDSDDDAKETQEMIEGEGRQCIVLKGDASKETVCRAIVEKTIKKFKGLDILVNNAGTHEEDRDIAGISSKQLANTFEVNLYSMFYLSAASLRVMKEGGVIINTTSVTAYRGSEHLLDYSASKGAIVTFTRSLALNVAEKGIRVNAVAPGPIWTPLVVYSFDEKHLKEFGKDTPMKRAGYPNEVAPAYVYLASDDSAYMTGQVLHVNGGDTTSS